MYKVEGIVDGEKVTIEWDIPNNNLNMLNEDDFGSRCYVCVIKDYDRRICRDCRYFKED